MVNVINLKQTGSGWQFEGEEALEDFVWANLLQLFGLTPLKRQYIIDEQRCDILALAENNQLVAIELKNVEDRYVVQQLTRYYHALQEQKPFREQVDYEQPIRLIAVTPSFHRDNFTDRKYSHLNIEFLQFGILVDGERFYLQLKDVDNNKNLQLDLPYKKVNYTCLKEDIPYPPKLLLDWLGGYPIEEQEKILQIREKILLFDKRIQKTSDSKSIKYGRGKTNPCAELCFQRKSKHLILFLWLPIPCRRKLLICRMQVHTDWSFYSKFSHVPEGFYNEKKNDTYFLRDRGKYVYTDLDVLIDDALNAWRNRL